MPIDESQILQWIGISSAGRRNAIIDDFMPQPEGIALMRDVDEQDLREANSIYAKRPNNPFSLGRIHLKRLYSLALWVKDKTRMDEEPEFDDGTNREQFLEQVQMAYERDERRKELRKVGEALLGKSFQVKLKNQTQWKRWSLELDSVLNSIVGVDGVPIRYVIRHKRHPDPGDRYGSWEEMAVANAPLSGPNFKQDSRTVHQIILANIHEESDAYTYVKPDLKYENGRRDIQNLRERYESSATQQATINAAKRVLSTLRYKHPRAMKFETFSAKLQRALDDLEECGRPEDNGNVVDNLWDRIQDPSLQAFKAALKVQYTLNPRSYRDILTDIAAEVASKDRSSFGGTANISSVQTADGVSMSGQAPSEGAHTADGKLFIGNYSSAAWKSEAVRPYHQEIREARGRNPGWKQKPGGPKSHSKGRPHSRAQGRKVKALKKRDKEIEQLKAKVASLESSAGDSDSTVKTSNPDTGAKDAGNSFGGKKSMSKT